MGNYGVVIERGGIVRKIRKLVYRLGFRPGLNSIFRSPSLELHYACLDAMKTRVKERRKNNWGGKF